MLPAVDRSLQYHCIILCSTNRVSFVLKQLHYQPIFSKLSLTCNDLLTLTCIFLLLDECKTIVMAYGSPVRKLRLYRSQGPLISKYDYICVTQASFFVFALPLGKLPSSWECR